MLKLCEDADELLVNHLDALLRGVVESFDLLFDKDLERLGANKEGWRRTRGVVKDRADVRVTQRVKGVNVADAAGKDLVEHKADTRTTRELCTGQVVVVAVERRAEIVCKIGDDAQEEVALQKVDFCVWKKPRYNKKSRVSLRGSRCRHCRERRPVRQVRCGT